MPPLFGGRLCSPFLSGRRAGGRLAEGPAHPYALFGHREPTGSVVPRNRGRPEPPSPRILATPLRAYSTDGNNNNERFHFFQVVLFLTSPPPAPPAPSNEDHMVPAPPPASAPPSAAAAERCRGAGPGLSLPPLPPRGGGRGAVGGAEGRRLDGAGRRRRPRRPRPWPGTGGPRPAPPVRRAGIGGRRHMTGHVLEAAQSKRKWGLV